MKERFGSVNVRQVDNRLLTLIVRAWFIPAIIALVALCSSSVAQAQDNTSNNTSNYWMEKGTELLWVGSYDEAVNAFDKAVQLDPENYEAWATKGRILTYLGGYDEALQAYDKAICIDSSRPEIQTPPLFAKAYTLMAMGRYKEAEELYDRITKLNFSSGENAKFIDAGFYLARGWRGKGIALAKLDRNDEALDAFDKSANLSSEYAPYAWTGKGDILRDIGRYEEAIYAYDMALDLYPDLANAGIALAEKGKGDALSKLGKSDEAITVYNVAIEAYNEEIKKFNKSSALDKAVSITINPYPVDGEFWYNMGSVLKALGRASEADEAFAKANELGYKNET